MSRSRPLPFPSLPKEISVREHDYSIRLITTEPKKENEQKEIVNPPVINTDDEYDEVTELFIEPIVTNVVKVLNVAFLTNIPLGEICHTDNMLEITPISDLKFQEEIGTTSYLSEVCKVCLKDVSNVEEKISFFDDCGQISSDIASISAALKSMDVEVVNDDKVPKQLCMECFHILSKMTFFKRICERSKRALAKMSEYTVKEQSKPTLKLEDDLDVMYDVTPNIVEIKNEPIFEPEPEIPISNEISTNKRKMKNPLNTDTTDADQNKSFICIRCGVDFHNQYTLMYHKRYEMCVDEKDPECRVCNEHFATLPSLDNHLVNSHKCFSCPKCMKSFNTLNKLNKHQRYHETLICDFCTQACHSKHTMRKHLMSHVIGAYPCPFCNQRFSTRKRVGIHKRDVHPNELYKCEHCSKEFRLKDTYRVHVMKHNPDKRYKCTYCPSQFVHRHHLNNHIRTHTKETPFLCNFCGKAFRGEVALRAHLSIHDPKMYPRRYKFPVKTTLKTCSMCDYSSIHGNLKKHMANVHNIGGRSAPREIKAYEYSCHICDKEFRLQTSLMNHLRIHNEVRDYHCTYCKASFRKAHYLRLHVDGVHLNKRPNKCDQCDAAYLISNDLKRHKLQKHSTARPFQCYYCQKTFKMAVNLKVHINRMHEVENVKGE